MRKKNLVKVAIVQAAENLFQKWGLNKTTMEDIAREASKGKSTLYYYFKSKEDVLDAVARAQTARILDKVRQEVGTKDTAKEKLLTYAYSMFQELRRSLTLYDIARGEIKADKALIAVLMQKFEALDEKILVSILKFGIERGEFKNIKSHDLKPTARAVMTIKRSLIINLFIDNDDKKLIDLVIGLLSEGL